VQMGQGGVFRLCSLREPGQTLETTESLFMFARQQKAQPPAEPVG